MAMNAQVHIMIETEALNSLKKEAKEKNTLVSEICRQKIMKSTQLEMIEFKLDKLIKMLGEKNNGFKSQ